MKRQLEEELDLEKAHDIKTPDVFARTETPAAKPVDSEPVPPHIPANDDDDSFSPAHDAEDIGTGVNEDDGSAGEAAATTDTETVVDNNDAADEEKELKS
jgi:hypothetical protein